MKLTQKESAVIRLRYGIDCDDPMTYQEISEIVDLGKTMVKQLELRALKKLKHLLKETTRELAQRTRSMAIATTDQGHLVSTGASNLLEQPEFYDIDVTKTMLSLLDRTDYWFELIQKSLGTTFEQDFHLLLGQDLGMELLEPCGFIYQHYEAGPYKGVMGVVGPARQPYSQVIPLVNYFANLIGEIAIS